MAVRVARRAVHVGPAHLGRADAAGAVAARDGRLGAPRCGPTAAPLPASLPVLCSGSERAPGGPPASSLATQARARPAGWCSVTACVPCRASAGPTSRAARAWPRRALQADMVWGARAAGRRRARPRAARLGARRPGAAALAAPCAGCHGGPAGLRRHAGALLGGHNKPKLRLGVWTATTSSGSVVRLSREWLA